MVSCHGQHLSLELGLRIRGQKMQTALDRLLRRFIGVGRLSVRWPDGHLSLYSGDDGPSAGIVIRTKSAVRALVLNPGLAFGEAYMDGSITPDGCGIYDVLEVMSANIGCDFERQPILR